MQAILSYVTRTVGRTFAELRRVPCLALLGLSLLQATTSTVQAGIFSLNDTGLNSSLTIDTTGQNGLSNWVVDGVDQLNQQWFWFRIGSAGPETSLDTLVSGGTEVVSNSNFVAGDDLFMAQYPDLLSRFLVEVRISLQAGVVGSNTSSVSQQITIKNTSGAVLPLRFFMLSDFDVQGDSAQDTVTITGGNTATQTDGVSFLSAEVASTPIPLHVQAGDAGDLNMLLTNATPTTLDNTVSYSGPGNPAWAYQWNTNVPVGGSFIISNSQSIQGVQEVPEPAAIGVALLGGLGALVVAWRHRRRGG